MDALGGDAVLERTRLGGVADQREVGEARSLEHCIAAERLHVVGSPLIDALRRYAREALNRAAWRTHGVDPGGYVLAILGGGEASAPALAVRAPLVTLEPGGAGFVERISLIRAAGVVVSDSERAHEEAAAFGIPCHTFEEAPGDPLPGTAVFARRTIPLLDAHAGARLADVMVANFALVRLG